MFRTIDNVATGKNPEDRVQKLETQVTDLKKTVAEELTKRMDELESWPGTSDDALMRFLQDSSNDAEGEPSTRGQPKAAEDAEPPTED